MHRSDDGNRSDNLGKLAPIAWMAIAVLGFGAELTAQSQVPAAVFARTNYVSAVNSAPGLTTPDYQASSGRVAANSRGDVFFQAKSFSNTADYVVEIPVSGGPQIELLSNLSGYTNPGVYADAGNNLWVPNQGGGTLIYVPFVNGTYASGVNVSTLPKCTTPLSQNTAPCNFYWNLSSIGNYIQPSDVSMDGNGNLYVMEKQDGITSGTRNRAIKASGTDGTVTVVVDNLNESGNAQVAVDAAGNVYYADGSGVYYFSAVSLPASSGTNFAVSLGTGLSDPTGVALDASGNLYICDTGNERIVEIPNLNGGHSSANQYTLMTAPEIPSGSALAQFGVGVDGYGNIYFVGNYGNSINHLANGNLALGSTTVGAGHQGVGSIAYRAGDG